MYASVHAGKTKPNKPNLPDAQMNVTSFITKDYENIHLLGRHKNKAKPNPIKPNFNYAQKFQKYSDNKTQLAG